MKELFVVRSAEVDPVHYGAFPTLELAKQFIDELEEEDPENPLDYDRVMYFETIEEAVRYNFED